MQSLIASTAIGIEASRAHDGDRARAGRRDGPEQRPWP
jgi:hypothetical protein